MCLDPCGRRAETEGRDSAEGRRDPPGGWGGTTGYDQSMGIVGLGGGGCDQSV